jgi:Trypsin-like peptidase domain
MSTPPTDDRVGASTTIARLSVTARSECSTSGGTAADRIFRSRRWKEGHPYRIPRQLGYVRLVSSRGKLDQTAAGPDDRSDDDSASTQDRRSDDSAGTAGTPGNRRPALIAGLVALALVLTAIGFYRWGSGGAAQPPPKAAPSASATRQPSTADIYTAVAPSVVTIEAFHTGATAVEDTGTGVIVNADGTILTALHVVKGAGSIRVTFADGTASDAVVTTSDAGMDIATLGPATLPSVVVPSVLGRSDQLAVGDNVIAIGNQLGLTRTTTTGVVSGLNRSATGDDGADLTGLIQFDAAVNPGSSGGPLVNAKGQIVGIVVALANPTSARTFIGVGFAVPINAAVTAGGGSRAPQQ